MPSVDTGVPYIWPDIFLSNTLDLDFFAFLGGHVSDAFKDVSTVLYTSGIFMFLNIIYELRIFSSWKKQVLLLFCVVVL